MPIDKIEYYIVTCDECGKVEEKVKDLYVLYKQGWSINWAGAGHTSALCPECVKEQKKELP